MTKLKVNKRRKALFGEAAATTVAAGIQAAATLASAGINAAATASAAKQNAAAQEQAAQVNADSLEKQNENNNKLQKQNIDFQKSENEKARQLEKDNQMMLQMLAGQQNTTQREEASKIQVRNGGSIKSNRIVTKHGNLPFRVLDGGGVVYLGSTANGEDLYEVIGNDHKHYHKAQGGKNKTGVGISFDTLPKGLSKYAKGGNATDNIVEAEGNQNTSKGELMLVSPTDAKFISKHNISGFNPREAVMLGLEPNIAFAIQESIKDEKNIPDDGKKATSGTIVRSIYNPTLSSSFVPIAVAIENDKKKNPTIAKYGTRVKAVRGKFLYDYNIANPNSYLNPLSANYNPNLDPKTNPNFNFTNNKSNKSSLPVGNLLKDSNKSLLIGSGISAGTQLLGAFANSIGNNLASKYSKQGLRAASQHMIDAYNKLKGIDLNTIKRDDFRAAHAMAALQAPIVNTGAETAAAERSLQRTRSQINDNTLSSAAAQNRNAVAETNYNDLINQIATNANKTKQAIIQGNMERITDVSNQNATRDIEANKNYAENLMQLRQYNNDIENQKIMGIGQTNANLYQGLANIDSSRATSNAKNWGNAVTNVGTIAGKTANTIGQNKFNYIGTLAGLSDEQLARLFDYSNDEEGLKSIIEAHAGDDPETPFYKLLQGIAKRRKLNI